MIEEKELDRMEVGKKYHVAKADGTIVRMAKGRDGTFFEYAKGKKNRGWYISREEAGRRYTLIDTPEKQEEDRKKTIRRAIKCLKKSGLWPEMVPIFENLLTVPLEKIRVFKRYGWEYNSRFKKDLPEDKKKEVEAIISEFPFLKNGDYLSDFIGPFKLKSMYFGACNKQEKEQIKKHLEEKKDYSGYGYTSYDVSFTYNAEKKKAWYSEEYRGCGNGHYYIALDENTALWMEDD